jgi:bifunctional DNA-binding transcriptional regulator/antitoxin component of YhaV-PrlF toxin-antitoxin module
VKFRAEVELGGKTATGIEVPEKVVAALGSTKKPAVRVTINGHTYRSTVATMGGRFMLPLSAENREKAGVAAGDAVDVIVELDTEAREIVVPADLARALKGDAAAKAFFEGLSFSKQRGIVDPIEQAKAPETRARRIEKAMQNLRAAKA